MEQVIQALFLGFVQGLTEFLPISSSGHLIIIPEIFNWTGVVDSLEFDVAVHLGTTLAVITYFWRDWANIFSSFFDSVFSDTKKVLENPSSRLLLLIIVGSIPAAIVGLLFRDFIETGVRSSLIVGVNLIVFGILLWITDKAVQEREFRKVGWKDTVLIGVAQAISLIPGVSRSGITIAAARSRGIKRDAAVRFSFLLSTPAIIGAGLLTSKELFYTGLTQNQSVFFVGFVAAAISGWIAIKFLLNFVKNNSFTVFVIYRIVLGSFLIIWSFVV